MFGEEATNIDQVLNKLDYYWGIVSHIFSELAEIHPFEILRSNKER